MAYTQTFEMDKGQQSRRDLSGHLLSSDWNTLGRDRFGHQAVAPLPAVTSVFDEAEQRDERLTQRVGTRLILEGGRALLVRAAGHLRRRLRWPRPHLDQRLRSPGSHFALDQPADAGGVDVVADFGDVPG
jgi:hypothetical protein